MRVLERRGVAVGRGVVSVQFGGVAAKTWVLWWRVAGRGEHSGEYCRISRV